MSLRTNFKASGVLAAALAMTFVSLPARADTVVSTISGSTLTVVTAGATLSGVTLTGANQTATGSATLPWSIADLRGTGAAWTVSVTATAPTSPAGSIELVPRVIPVGNLTITTGTITPGVGSDAITNITGSTALAMTGSSQSLFSSSGTNKGTYAITPSFSLSVPANSYRSNYTAAIGSTALLPYSSTLTYTIA